MESVLKPCKIPKYCEQNCRILDLRSWTHNLETNNHDLRRKIQDPKYEIQDLGPTIKKPDPGRDICDQVLGFIWHIILAFLSQVFFVIWK